MKIKINSKLKEAANFNPTKTTFQQSIEELNQLIDSNKITLPLYQRDVSWSLQKSVDLFNYQLNGKAPVSAISFNKMTSRYKSGENYVPQVTVIHRDLVDIESLEAGHYSIVDGQQRLTTNYKAYISDDDFRNIVLDLSKGEFTIINESLSTRQIPIGVLLNKDSNVLSEFIRRNKQFQDWDVTETIQAIRTKIKSYNYTINLANDLSEDEQVNWFEVLNNAGSRVTRIQMNFSKMRIHDIDIYAHYTNPFMDILENYGYGDIFNVKSTEVSIPIAALNPAYEVIKKVTHKPGFSPIAPDEKSNQLSKLNANEIKSCFNMTFKALEKALDFISENNLKAPKRLDYITYLLGYFIWNNDELTVETKLALIDWYNTVSFTNKSNGERRQLFDNLIILKK